ncbi:PilZ domain-containing protein [Croceibacterium ferulae]|uniref:PilZ domain-containing protein n=1 Tax=Croceibacterium ferulae TaxID=1854641 RepID=UPI000EB43840|nr:PilZ domain-containing protein [Croceibacterium ferulae]
MIFQAVKAYLSSSTSSESLIMPYGAQLTIIDLRAAIRHRVDFDVVGQFVKDDTKRTYRVRDLSSNGALIGPVTNLKSGERLVLLFPGIGAIEAHCIWTDNQLAGFQFERPLQMDELMIVSDALQLKLPLGRTKSRSSLRAFYL